MTETEVLNLIIYCLVFMVYVFIALDSTFEFNYIISTKDKSQFNLAYIIIMIICLTGMFLLGREIMRVLNNI